MRSVKELSKSIELKRDADYRKYCESESDEAYKVANESQAEYDKQLLALSAGLLGVLLAFVKDIVPLQHAICKQLLYWGYGCLGFCVLAVLISFQLSIFALRKVRSHWKAEYDERDSSSFPYGWDKVIFIVNIMNGIIFAVGLGLCLSFIIRNLAYNSGKDEVKCPPGIFRRV
jgi:hypothetical protein